MKPTTVDVDSTYHTSETYSLSEQIIEVVADAEGVDPLELTPLFTAIDPDALDDFFRASEDSQTPPATVQFSYQGYEISVTADGGVSLVDRPSESTEQL